MNLWEAVRSITKPLKIIIITKNCKNFNCIAISMVHVCTPNVYGLNHYLGVQNICMYAKYEFPGMYYSIFWTSLVSTSNTRFPLNVACSVLYFIAKKLLTPYVLHTKDIICYKVSFLVIYFKKSSQKGQKQLYIPTNYCDNSSIWNRR